MKIIKEPTIHLIAKNDVCHDELAKGLNEFATEWQSDAPSGGELIAEIAGRICYLSFKSPRPGGNKEYIRRIKEAGHGSVLEHASYTFLFQNVSRSLTHELVRHRAGWAYSQLSQRYVDESVAEYVMPDVIANDPECRKLWLDAVGRAHQSYIELTNRLDKHYASETDKTLRRKLARQAARSVLPNATETKIVVTANARALRHFIEMRANRHADVEIRKLANRMLDILQDESPYIFGDYQRVELPDGTYEAWTQYGKV